VLIVLALLYTIIGNALMYSPPLSDKFLLRRKYTPNIDKFED